METADWEGIYNFEIPVLWAGSNSRNHPGPRNRRCIALALKSAVWGGLVNASYVDLVCKYLDKTYHMFLLAKKIRIDIIVFFPSLAWNNDALSKNSTTESSNLNLLRSKDRNFMNIL